VVPQSNIKDDAIGPENLAVDEGYDALYLRLKHVAETT
jgi:hypothetical protein